MKKWLIRLISAVLLVAATLVVGGAGSAVSRLPDLEPWHHLVSRLEPRADEITSTFTLEDYLAREEAVFRELEQQVDTPVSKGANPAVANRYVTASRSHPTKLGTNWNRTQILAPAEPAGGALLIHGLTDSPYSMRALAALLNARGYYTLSLRLQGHGTVPGGLVNTTWEDWAAAVRMGARHVRQVIGPDAPLVLVGHSNGGAQVTKYALDTLEDPALPAPSRLILVSPMIGVSPMARLARAISRLGPVVEKARWLDIFPEYNPFKYNSFPANAAVQTARFTRVIDDQIARVTREGRIGQMPPVLAFQSVVDTTVSTRAIVTDLFDRLPAGRNELVLFDLNRQAGTDALLKVGAVLPLLTGDRPRPYAVTLVTNTDAATLEVSAMSVAAGTTAIAAEPLGLAWPSEVYSLSHIALPFPADDPVYGGAGTGRESGSLSLGRLAPRGEKNVLIVPMDVLMRLSWNPFFPYMANRVDRWIQSGP